MRRFLIGLSTLALAAVAAPAIAADLGGGVSATVSATVTSDYRFRGLTQSDEDPALQGGLTLGHSSGFYAAIWGSTIDDDTSLPGYGGAEVDLSAGWSGEVTSGLTLDGGLLYYWYPDGATGVATDFFEPYASVTFQAGPVKTKIGAAYAFAGQQGLADEDSLYLYGDLSTAIPGTPLTAKAHLGRTKGQLGLLAKENEYWDWSVGLEGTSGPITVGVAYVDTDISNRATMATPGGYANAIGADSTALGYITIAF